MRVCAGGGFAVRTSVPDIGVNVEDTTVFFNHRQDQYFEPVIIFASYRSSFSSMQLCHLTLIRHNQGHLQRRWHLVCRWCLTCWTWRERPAAAACCAKARGAAGHPGHRCPGPAGARRAARARPGRPGGCARCTHSCPCPRSPSAPAIQDRHPSSFQLLQTTSHLMSSSWMHTIRASPAQSRHCGSWKAIHGKPACRLAAA